MTPPDGNTHGRPDWHAQDLTVFAVLDTHAQRLTRQEAGQRLAQYGPNRLRAARTFAALHSAISQRPDLCFAGGRAVDSRSALESLIKKSVIGGNVHHMSGRPDQMIPKFIQQNRHFGDGNSGALGYSQFRGRQYGRKHSAKTRLLFTGDETQWVRLSSESVLKNGA